MKRLKWYAASLCLLFVWGIVALLTASSATATYPTPSSTPDPQVWITNGTVDAIAIAPNGTTYIGGDFTHVGPNRAGAAALDATSGACNVSFPPVNGTVKVAVSDGAGGYYIGGSFTKLGDITRNNVAHILADGSVDPAFDPNASGYVYALAVSGSTVYVGGYFTIDRRTGAQQSRRSRCQRQRHDLGSQRKQRGLCPCHLGCDRLRRRGFLQHHGLQLHRRSAAQLHRRTRRDQRRCHSLGPKREQHGLHPRRLGAERLRWRVLYVDRRPAPSLHRRSRCDQRHRHGLRP